MQPSASQLEQQVLGCSRTRPRLGISYFRWACLLLARSLLLQLLPVKSSAVRLQDHCKALASQLDQETDAPSALSLAIPLLLAQVRNMCASPAQTQYATGQD